MSVTDDKVAYRASASVALLLVTGAFSVLLLRPGLSRLLATATRGVDVFWTAGLWWMPWGVLLLLMVPALVVFLGTDNRHWRWAALGWATLVFFLLSFDQYLYVAYGRHLYHLLAYTRMPQGGEAAGNLQMWVGRTATTLVWALLFSGLIALTHEALFRVSRYLSRTLRWTALSLALTVYAGLTAMPWLMAPLVPDGFGPRLLSLLPFRPVFSEQDWGYTPEDPRLARLQERLEATYAELFSYFYGKHRLPEVPLSPPSPPPDIHIIVAESFRWQQLNPHLMPRMFEWSQRGLRFERHYAATNHSETALFVMLYGKSALTYDSTLDDEVPPTLFELLETVGYQSGYFTGHPEKWIRRDEFLNREHLDVYVHHQGETWNDWDEASLASAAEHLRRPSPMVALTFLMSSHYEYRYPERYALHQPDDPPKIAWFPGQASPSEYETNKNRYWNVTAYLDDLLADHIDSLPDDTIVIFTGDHGEATGEHGRFGHGYDFSDPLTRVPLVMVGPGIQPGVRRDLTSHLDVLPTIAQALGAQWPEHTIGYPLQEASDRRSLLQVYTRKDLPYATALLMHDGLRLRLRINPHKPLLDVLGFEDENGDPVDVDLTSERIDQLDQDFRRQLERGAKPIP